LLKNGEIKVKKTIVSVFLLRKLKFLENGKKK
jgi:hypothetical protein